MDMNYYEILGLPRDASTEDINKAYRVLIVKYHPDVRGESGRAFTEYLNVIHDTLTNDDKRRAYDDKLKHGVPVDDARGAGHDSSDEEDHQPGFDHDADDREEATAEADRTTHQRRPEEDGEPVASPKDVQAPWSIRFLITTVIMTFIYPICAHVIGQRITHLIPANPITAMIPNSPFIIPALELLCIVGLGYVMLYTVHSRFMHMMTLMLGAPATIAVMSVIPYYVPLNLHVIIWMLMPLFILGYEVVRVLNAKRYEQMRRMAVIEQRHLYMIQSLRLNDNQDAYVALLADEHNIRTQRTIWGQAKPGDYVILGDGDDIEHRLGYQYATHWSDMVSRRLISKLFTGGRAFA